MGCKNAAGLLSSFFSPPSPPPLRRGLRFPPAMALNIFVWQWKLNHLLRFTPLHLTSSSFDGALFSKSGSRYSQFMRSSSGVRKTHEGFEYHKRGSASKWRSCLQVLIQKELDESSAIISHYHGGVLLAPCCFSCQEEEKNEAPLKEKQGNWHLLSRVYNHGLRRLSEAQRIN